MDNDDAKKTPSTAAAAPKVATITKKDIETNKVWAIVAYLGIIGIIIVMLTEGKDSPFAKFHLNQSLPLAIAAFGGSAVLAAIPILGWLLLPFFSIAVIVLVVMGIINAAQGQVKRLPIVGNFELIK